MSVAILRNGTWTTKQVARSGDRPSVVTKGRHTYVAMVDFADLLYLTNDSGRWRTEVVRTTLDSTIPMIAVDARGQPHIAIGQERSPARVSYAHRQAGHWRVQDIAGPSDILAGIAVGADDGVRIGYTAVKDRYPGDLCLEDCDAPVGFHVRRLVGTRWTDVAVPGHGFGVFDIDAAGRPSVLRADAQLSWRARRSDTWLTRSWKRPWHGRVGSLIEPVRSQWIAVRGDVTYLFYRSVDGATWMIEGTLPRS